MNIIKKFIPAGTNARSGYAMTPQYITIHNTANTKAGANAKSHASYMTGSGSKTTVSYHYVVDDKEAYQLLPDNEVAWHAGDGSNGTGNRKSLAIEICENSDGDLLKATNNTVELTAYLMKKYNIPLSKVVQHNNWSGKNCPNRIRAGQPYNWQTFINKVQASYNEGTTNATASAAANVKPFSENPCRLYIGFASQGDIKTIKAKIAELGIEAKSDEGYIITNEMSKGDQVTIIAMCKDLGVGCKIYEEPKQEVVTKGLQASSLKSLTETQIVDKIGSLFTADQKKTGVLASVSMGQFLLESAYGKSELAQNANNCFGMKQNLSGNTWAGSAWDGKSIYNKITKEFVEGEYIEITAPFRKYACIEDSIADHSAYLIGAKKGDALRYAGLKGETNYQKAAQIIKDGGYATSPTYVTNLCNVIQKWNLTKYDVVQSTDKPITPSTPSADAKPSTAVTSKFKKGDEIKLVSGAKYTSGKSIPNWVLKSKLYVREVRDNDDIVFSTLKIGAITGVVNPKYVVGYAEDAGFKPYTVKVLCSSLNIRKTPKWGNADIVGVIKDKGVYTIVDEKMLGLTKFGLLKSGEKNRDKWISLGSAYVKKV